MTDGAVEFQVADVKARAFVNGMTDEVRHGERTGRMVIHTGHWSRHFQDHPWVQAAESEGWGRELRMSVTQAVKRRILAGQAYSDINQLMPSKELAMFWKEKALRERDAAKWQDDRYARGESKSMEARPLVVATRNVFASMQRVSRNGYHLEPLAELEIVAKKMGAQ